jgi:hypothetical protein
VGRENNGGKLPTMLTPERIADINRDHAVIYFSDRGVALVKNEADGSLLTYTAFKKRLGVVGALWLLSDQKRMYPSLARYEKECAEHSGMLVRHA